MTDDKRQINIKIQQEYRAKNKTMLAVKALARRRALGVKERSTPSPYYILYRNYRDGHMAYDEYRQARRVLSGKDPRGITREQLVIRRLKLKAAKLGIPFNITIEDVKTPSYCPILGIPLIYANICSTDNSPSIDRIIPKLGYIKGNVVVISRRANRIKNDATISELQKISDFYNKLASTTTSPDNNVTNKDLVNPG